MKPLLLGYDASEKPLLLDPNDAKTHTHVLGSSGSGKSKFLESIMREHLRNRQGFALLDPHGTLFDDLVAFCAHHALDREVKLLNVSRPSTIVGFNPFQRAPEGDISVQVDRRITATMHAWGVPDTDQTPTLARTLRLIYTVMLEQNLGLPQVQHLIDFNASELRGSMIERLDSVLVQKEWRELQMLKAKDWRDETLSAKNRLFKFLTSEALCRFMGLPGRSINLRKIMDDGSVLLVNLAESDYLSHENARAFGALLVNEFFENALRRERDQYGRPPQPFHLIMDEFQSFVSVDIADMLDQVRKFGLFLTLAHQRFGHLDENITDAVLTNCRIKAVFGGLPIESARMMAEELFIRELDAKKIKVAIYQTKFWPREETRQVRTRATSHTSSSGWMESSASGHSSGMSSGEFFGPSDWFGPATSMGTTTGTNSGSSWSSGSGSSGSEGYGESESVADIPVFVPVPYQELSSVQYYTHEEQLTELTAALKEQFPRHCFIKIQGQQTQPLLVPFIESIRSFQGSDENLEWYRQWQNKKQHALPAAEVDRLIKEQELALLQVTAHAQPVLSQTSGDVNALPRGARSLPPSVTSKPKRQSQGSIWNRGGRTGKTVSADQLPLAMKEPHD